MGGALLLPTNRGELKGGLFCMRCNTPLPSASPLLVGKKMSKQEKSINKMTNALSGFISSHYVYLASNIKTGCCKIRQGFIVGAVMVLWHMPHYIGLSRASWPQPSCTAGAVARICPFDRLKIAFVNCAFVSAVLPHRN